MFLYFNPMAFMHNLGYMVKGMLVILIVMLVLIAVTLFLNWATSRKKK